MDNFTPGPWRVYQEKPHYYSIGTDYAHDRGHDSNIVRDIRNEANARLMGSAPELLEQLQTLTNHFESLIRHVGKSALGFQNIERTLADAYMAIAKAKGEVSRG